MMYDVTTAAIIIITIVATRPEINMFMRPLFLGVVVFCINNYLIID